MFQWYWPWMAVLLPLPFLIRWLFPLPQSSKKHAAPLLRFPFSGRIKEAFSLQEVSTRGGRYTAILLSLVWVLLVLALMRPEKADQFTQVHNIGYDLMLAVDISPSMQALDFSTATQAVSRLDVTKDVVGKFALGRRGDRVGLVVFGENAYLHVPLTLDTLSVSRMLDETVEGMAGKATAIGDAIGLSVKTLRERPEGSRVLVLLSDGEDNSSSVPPLEAARLAKQYGIRIYTVGVGKEGPVPFPTQYGGYRMVNMALDEDLLREIATVTGGEYFRATDQAALKQIYQKIDQLEKTESNVEQFLVRHPLYRYPLSLAMALILLLVLAYAYKGASNEL